MKTWEIASMSFGTAILLSSFLFLGIPPLNFAGISLILFPPTLYLIRRLEGFFQSSRTQ